METACINPEQFLDRLIEYTPGVLGTRGAEEEGGNQVQYEKETTVYS